MTKEEAYILLSFHSCRNNDIENEKWKQHDYSPYPEINRAILSFILSVL